MEWPASHRGPDTARLGIFEQVPDVLVGIGPQALHHLLWLWFTL